MTLCEPGSDGAILRITADDPLRRELSERGFVSGAEIKLLKVDDEVFTCKINHREENLKLNEAATIWIQQPSR